MRLIPHLDTGVIHICPLDNNLTSPHYFPTWLLDSSFDSFFGLLLENALAILVLVSFLGGAGFFVSSLSTFSSFPSK